ncbi:MAG: SagB/ThcOx family dehydrogenase [Deltaproteobacteria bacterium]|nr:SagB/ThcOx family dehydrogenase [Deltaproteobacteria bacterium]
MTERIESAFDYHAAVSYRRGALGGGGLDWSMRPETDRRYEDCSTLALPEPLAEAGPSDPARLSALLAASCGVSAVARTPAGSFFYRSAPSAGALYPIELFLAGRPWGFEPGVYHYAPERHALQRLAPLASGRGLSLLLAAEFFRSGWKYRQRAYRYCLLDAGHVLENILCALDALGAARRSRLDFDDAAAARLCGLAPGRESALAWVAAGEDLPDELPEAAGTVPAGLPCAPRVGDLPLVQAADALCAEAAPGQGEASGPDVLSARAEDWIPLEPAAMPVGRDFFAAVIARRSRRDYRKALLAPADLGALAASLRLEDPLPELGAGVLLPGGGEIAAGLYALDAAGCRLGRLLEGVLHRCAAAACLDQGWLADAGALFVFAADLEALEARLGPRGYRHALIRAGRLGQRLYLAATARGLGACGIGAFYDDEAAALLGLRGGQRLLYLVAVGEITGSAG